MTEVYSQAALSLLGEIVQVSMRVDGLSFASFAQVTGAHKTTIERLIKGEVKDPVPVLRKIAKFVHLVDLEPQSDSSSLISKVHLLRYYKTWQDLESILESQSGSQRMPTYCAVSQTIRTAIANKGRDPDSEEAIEEFARSGPWSKNLQRLKNIVLGQVNATRDDVAAIAYTLTKYTGEQISPDDIVKLLHQHNHDHHESGDCVNHH